MTPTVDGTVGHRLVTRRKGEFFLLPSIRRKARMDPTLSQTTSTSADQMTDAIRNTSQQPAHNPDWP
jgi:hypothetical protein